MYGFGSTLKTLREERSLSQLQLSEAIGVSPSSITMYEREERIPRDLVKIKLANFFNVSVESIFFAQEQHLEWCNLELL